jgi:tetratricopeptide (TPR) repeat protein
MKNTNVFYEEGRKYYKQGDLNNAKKSIKNAIKQNDSFTEVHVILGLVYDKLQDHGKAEQEFDRAFALRPISEDYRIEMADFYKEIGKKSIENQDIGKAIKCLVKSMYLNKDDEETKRSLALSYYQAAIICLKSKRFSLADKYFQNARMVYPQLPGLGGKTADPNGTAPKTDIQKQ